MSRRQTIISGQKRAEYGSITTWRNAAGNTVTIHVVGPPQAGLKETIEHLLELDETFRLCSYSTPDTIYTDLIGARSDWVNEGRAVDGKIGVRYGMANPVALPERIVLGLIGRQELIHVELTRTVSEK